MAYKNSFQAAAEADRASEEIRRVARVFSRVNGALNETEHGDVTSHLRSAAAAVRRLQRHVDELPIVNR